ncbi:MAG TPA: ABC transporter permease [Paludibacteraceae bacterium]|nr:ABC transporter permease [Paludibacteraceae bacterium]HQB68946.1 ABC transporter permease [Paludibacteraceae bacterium]HRS67476.1 ABC transporter permease [Paludibacteraceae bacterium]
MSKIGLVIAQEYKNRVAKKSFLVLTFLMPLLFVALIFTPIWLATLTDGEIKQIAVVDQTGKYASVFTDNDAYTFELIGEPVDSLRTSEKRSDYEAIVVISKDLATTPEAVTIYSEKQVNIELKNFIEQGLNSFVEKEKLLSHNIPNIQEIIDESQANIRVNTIKWSEDGSEEISSSEIAVAIGMVFTMLIYMFIFTYGAQVMSSVVQEKINRIVEVLICSVKPFELMMGKIISIALVGLTQFAIWLFLTVGLVAVAGQFLGNSITPETAVSVEQMSEVAQASSKLNFDNVMAMIMSVNPLELIFYFIIYFIGGYLLYASIFAAIGSAVDNETDTQQFMLPVTIPIIFAIYAAIYGAQNPDGPLALWCSMIPFTSPIVMMVRLPLGVPMWEKLLSVTILIISFIATTWMSAKIYRTGILMYGKKTSWKEMWKWIRY